MTEHAGGEYSPKDSKSLVVIIDDINLPETHCPLTDRPATELIRHMMSWKSYHHGASAAQRTLTGFSFAASVTLHEPFNKETGLKQRLLQHFNPIHFNQPNMSCLNAIYNAQMRTHWAEETAISVKGSSDNVVAALVALLLSVQTEIQAKSRACHYRFSLHTLDNVSKNEQLSCSRTR